MSNRKDRPFVDSSPGFLVFVGSAIVAMGLLLYFPDMNLGGALLTCIGFAVVAIGLLAYRI